MYDRVLKYIIFYRMHKFAHSKCIFISSWLVYYNFILHVVLYQVNYLYLTIK